MPDAGGGDVGVTSHSTDVIIIGAGPVGLFAVFELGLLGLTTHVVDILDRPGGQCAELYPEKAILDIPSRLKITGQELTEDLMKQIEPFKPVFHFQEMGQKLEKLDNGRWRLTTDQGTQIEAAVIVIAGGGGSFTPKKPKIERLDEFEGKSLFYAVRKIEQFRGKNVLIAGGGDSALDWTVNLNPVVAGMTLVHRRNDFRGMQATVDQMYALVKAGKVNLQIGDILRINGENGQIRSLTLKSAEQGEFEVPCDTLLPFYGLTMKLGPIADWGIKLDDNDRIPVSTENFETNVPGVFCIGDMCAYPGKLKLILSGFHESALMAHGCFHYARPNQKLKFEHTTSSSSIQAKIGAS
ncbi:MAG: NAD(P)/FAD-dependent oxidoreductase [Rhodospirillaceae bacterium]|nr:MAG: NAD(P)/FAD-dependent oxidoreductase [Rhodospirillaceae bacterium]